MRYIGLILTLWSMPLVVLGGSVAGRRISYKSNAFAEKNAVAQQQQQQQQDKPETFVDLVRSTTTDYHVEEHEITTDDGYILTTHRMPGGLKSPVTPNKPAILLIHGLLAASDVWVLRGPDKDLAYKLVDAGYDVWFMNTRGNFYGRRHKKLVPKEEKFWRFSWHESGIYDAASVIDHILSTTGLEKVAIIGHSMGTTIGLVLLSEKPEYNAKVSVMLSFAPVAIFTHLVPGPVAAITVRYGRQLQKTAKTLGVREIFPRSNSMLLAYSTFCQAPHIEMLCQMVIMHFSGLLRTTGFDVIDVNLLPRMLRHYPQGSSVETLFHYRQIMISGKFRQYDFGLEGNYLRYKNSTPPEYRLERVTVPTVLYYGPNDAYTTEEDVEALLARIPHGEARLVDRVSFGHLDFLVSNFTDEVYKDVLETLEPYRDDRKTIAASLDQAIEQAKNAPSTVIV